MRVAVLANYAESFISFRGNLVKDLISSGHEVSVLLPPNKTVHAQLESIGVSVIDIGVERSSINPFTDLSLLVEYVHTLRRIKPDITLNYTIKPVIYGSIAAYFVKVKGIYSVITGLGYVFTGNTLRHKLIRSFVVSLYRLAAKFNNIIFFLNEDDRKLFNKYRILRESDDTKLIDGEGVDVEHFRYVAPVTGQIVFLLIARLLWDKGIKEYVEAASILKQTNAGCKFLLLGPCDTNPSAIPHDQIQEWINNGLVDYLGETDDVRPVIAASSVYVLPSYREGVPRTILEAMSMARPIVTTDAPGCRETVRDGENGFLVPVGNAQALATAMKRFILEPELISMMGKRSREIAVEKYDVHKVNAVMMTAMGLHSEKTV